MTAPNTPASNDFVLKACPFCGGEAKLVTGTSSTVQCQNDQCIIGDPAPFNDFSHRADAISAWNTRLATAPASPEPLNKERRNNAELLASSCQKARHSSASPFERDGALRDAATMLRDFARSVAPAASPEPDSNEAPGRGGETDEDAAERIVAEYRDDRASIALAAIAWARANPR